MFYTPALVWNMGENVSHQEIEWWWLIWSI